ncbi:hypothetical protein Tco_1077678 [Tanacetum coccineum]
MDANFLPLYAQVVLSTVDAFVEKQVAGYTGVNGDEGVVGIGTCVTRNSPMQNTIVTPMCRPSEVTNGTKNVTAGAELNSTSSTKANLRKLESNVTNDADYDVWLPLDLIHEVNDRMKNSLYRYFISKRLAFPIVDWFREELFMSSNPVTLLEGHANAYATTRSAPAADFATATLSKYNPVDQFPHAPMSPTC